MAAGEHIPSSSGLILASDVDEGLFILKPEYQRAAFWDLTVLDDSLQLPIAEAEVWLAGEFQGRTDQNGMLSLAKADSGYLP